MKKLRLDKIVEIIENNKTISKHISGSGQTIRLELGYDPKIMVSGNKVEVFVNVDKNIFTKTMKKLKEEHKELIKDIRFWKSDGSCNSNITIWLKEM